MQLDTTLNEICKLSIIKATTALSKFLQIPLGVDMKPVEIKQLEDISVFNDSKENTVNIFMPIIGNLAGCSFFCYTKESALLLCDVLFNRKEGSTQNFTDPEISALSEVANIVIGNFLTPFAKSLQMDFLMHRSAIFDCAPFNTTLNNQFPTNNNKDTHLINISFDFQQTKIQGYVLIVFDERKISSVLKNIS